MKKVNFKKLTNQFLAGVFALTLMGGMMLNTQDVMAQELTPNPGGGGGFTWDLGLCFTVEGGMEAGCYFLAIEGPCSSRDASCK